MIKTWQKVWGMQEEWRAIEESDGMYEVSNTGKVRSLNYNKTGRVQELKQKIDRYGYCIVTLHIDGKQKYPPVHRLVAQAFIPNPDNKSQVNHISGIKTDNNVKNLEWCTSSENIKHAFNHGLKEKSIIHARNNILRYNESCKKEITAISILDNSVFHFDSIKDASEKLGIKDINKPLSKKTLTANGYCFEYGTLNDEEAKQVKKCVIDKLGAKKFNALLKRLEKKGVMPCQK